MGDKLIKMYKDNIFISIKLDEKKDQHYVATMFDTKMEKIESYECKTIDEQESLTRRSPLGNLI